MSGHLQKVERARARMEDARDAVYAAAYPSRDVPLSQCRAMASAEVREAYDLACKHVDEAERAAIKAGKAWRGQFDMLYWY